jgi:tetratricopeptide (TPR) repeat protein
VRLLAVVVVACVAGACHPSPRPGARADGADAPYRLDDDDDRAEERDRLAAMRTDDPERLPLRARLAAALAGALGDELDRHRLRRAQLYLTELLSLWEPDPDRFGAEAGDLVPALLTARNTLAKAGIDDGTIMALAALVEADPVNTAAWSAELDEILAFTDDLARAQGGADAVRARAIPALAPAVAALPVGWLVDRYVGLVTARQEAVNALLLQSGATIELVQAHHDVLDAGNQVAGALARAGRLDELAARVSRMTGLGIERRLGVAAGAIAGAPDSPEPYRILAGVLRDGRRDDAVDDDDPAAAYAICRAALARRPRDAVLLACAAEHAAAADRPQVAIRLLEDAFADGAEDSEGARRLAGLYRDRIGRLGFSGRLGAARQVRKQLRAFLDSVKGRGPAVASILAWRRDGDVVLARALVSQGHLEEATKILVEVAEHAPTVDALEALAAIASDRGRFADARTVLEQAILLGGDKIAEQLVRARIHRLAAEAAREGGDDAGAANHYVAALSIWASLATDEDRPVELPPEVNGLRLVEIARSLWAIGDPDKAINMLRAALDVDSDGEQTHIQVVAFLLLEGRLAEATGAFHRALVSEQISDEGKVYMALWLLGEARRDGEAPDPAAVELLEGRAGTAWSDALARAATGRIGVAALARRATSATERAELAFYTATLSLGAPAPARVKELLEEVVRSDLILVFEREIARNRLSSP